MNFASFLLYFKFSLANANLVEKNEFHVLFLSYRYNLFYSSKNQEVYKSRRLFYKEAFNARNITKVRFIHLTLFIFPSTYYDVNPLVAQFHSCFVCLCQRFRHLQSTSPKLGVNMNF